tara:strand:+ start:1048 stop:2193 length:1146 start_codon:yes stop_codon:yes gene_type:complete
MSYIFADDVNFNYNLTSKLRHDNLITFPSLTAAEKGFVFFHTANNKFYGWTGTTWIDFSLGAGGGDVFLATTQTFTGYKTFSGGILIDDSLAFIKRAVNITSSSQGLVYFKTDNTFNISVGTGAGAHNATFDGIDAFTAARTFTLPDANGTLALEGSFVDLTNSQTIGGAKTFTADTELSGLLLTADGTFSAENGIKYSSTSGFVFREGVGQPFTFKGQGLTAIRVQTIQNKSGTLAHLDDLSGLQTAEGTFTPTFNAFSGNDYTVSSVFSSYYRIGNMVTVRIGANGITDGASTAGRFRITGLPYSVSGTNSGSYVASYTTARGASIDFFTYSPYMSGTEINFSQHGTAATSNPTAVTWTGTTTQKALDFSITYFTTDAF